MMRCRTWMRLWGCRPWCHSTEVIIICIRHDAPAPTPWCLNKHLEIICVHLGLLLFGPRCSSTFASSCLVTIARLSTIIAHPHGMRRWKPPKPVRREELPRFFADHMMETISAHSVRSRSGPLSFPPLPLICLRHHSLGAGRHSLHQA